MTVSDLIEAMSKLDKNMDVYLDIKAKAPNFDQTLTVQAVYESGGVFFIQGKEGE